MEQGAGENFPEAGQEFDAFEGSDAGGDSGDGAEDGELTLPLGRHFGVEAGKAGCLAGDDGDDLTLHGKHGGVD